MDNIYIAYNFTVAPVEPASEILIAELGNVGFESFVENENGVVAYIQKNEWNAAILEDIFILKSDEFQIEFSKKEVAQTNWNAEWEKNFNPIEVDDLVSVRAPFHKNISLKYDIVIEPKMSFGTGHHETTHMMIQHLLHMDVKGKSVLDMGCGTGILAILAEKLGATNLDAIDIDNWCYVNSLENVARNHCKNISVAEGDASIIKKKYDVIIANINRNILLNDMEVYKKALHKDGILLLSGFYKADIQIIKSKVATLDLIFVKQLERNNWVALQFRNP